MVYCKKMRRLLVGLNMCRDAFDGVPPQAVVRSNLKIGIFIGEKRRRRPFGQIRSALLHRASKPCFGLLPVITFIRIKIEKYGFQKREMWQYRIREIHAMLQSANKPCLECCPRSLLLSTSISSSTPTWNATGFFLAQHLFA